MADFKAEIGQAQDAPEHFVTESQKKKSSKNDGHISKGYSTQFKGSPTG